MRKSFLLAFVLAAAPSAVLAKDPVFVTAKAVKDKPSITLDRSRAYLLIRSEEGAPFLFMKDPSAEDSAEYSRIKAEAFAKERERFIKRRAAYQRDLAAWKSSSGSHRPAKPELPVEPTEDNFQFVPFELMANFAVGPQNRFKKGDESIYLHEVTPGSYRLYGPVFTGAQGEMAGVCFCMGSVRFTARAGEIVDLGRAVRPDAAKPAPGDSSSPLTTAAMSYRIEPPTKEMSVDPRLSGMKISPAEYRAAGKLPNFFGLAIDRLHPIPNILAYERDRVVDLAAAPQSAASQ